MKWETKKVNNYSEWDEANIGKFNEEQEPLIPMDPQTGRKLQFVGSGTFGKGKMNGTAASPAEKGTNGTVGTTVAANNDGVPLETVTKTMKKRLRRKRNKWTLIITFSSLVLIIIFITIAYLVARQSTQSGKLVKTVCNDSLSCNMILTETIPSVLQYKAGSPKHDTISSHWRSLIQSAKSSINMLSFYWSLDPSDIKGGPYKQADIGKKILMDLRNAAGRGVKIQIVQNSKNKDTEDLSKLKNVEVRTINMTRLLKAGIIHTKFFAVDGRSVYVGSANFDWRALTEVKELGVVMYDCPCSVADANKMFEINWMLAHDASRIPVRWPEKYDTQYNKDNPMVVKRKESPPMKLYWSLSPPPFCPSKRTSDKEAIIDMITNARKYIYIAVMDYMAAMVYVWPRKYWDVIDRALRVAVFEHGVEVRLMTSKWSHTSSQEIVFLKSLNEFGKMTKVKGKLKVRMFQMPNSSIPYTRVSHSKFMVTDKAAFVSTSNWSGDYFENTGGVSLVMDDKGPANSTSKGSMHYQLVQVFLRDWGSNYAKDI